MKFDVPITVRLDSEQKELLRRFAKSRKPKLGLSTAARALIEDGLERAGFHLRNNRK